MNRTPIVPDLAQFPEEVHPLFQNTPVYDSSCSPTARVWFLDRDGGLFLKSAPAGRLPITPEPPQRRPPGRRFSVFAFAPEKSGLSPTIYDILPLAP